MNRALILALLLIQMTGIAGSSAASQKREWRKGVEPPRIDSVRLADGPRHHIPRR